MCWSRRSSSISETDSATSASTCSRMWSRGDCYYGATDFLHRLWRSTRQRSTRWRRKHGACDLDLGGGGIAESCTWWAAPTCARTSNLTALKYSPAALISLIIIGRNEQKHLARCIESCLAAD